MVLSVNEENFLKEVLESSVPVIVNFWAPWCGACRLLTPLLSSFQTEWGEHLKVVNINADENFKLANTYRLKTLPTILLFDSGNILHRVDGMLNRDDLHQASNSLRSSLENLQTSYPYTA